MTVRKSPPPPGPTVAEVAFRGTDPEPLSADERAWRKWITKERGEAELKALAHELAGVEALEASLGAAVAAILAQADETERAVGPGPARHVRAQASDLEQRGERTAARAEHIREQIAWRKKALKAG
jgi:hypothetical protein